MPEVHRCPQCRNYIDGSVDRYTLQEVGEFGRAAFHPLCYDAWLADIHASSPIVQKRIMAVFGACAVCGVFAYWMLG